MSANQDSNKQPLYCFTCKKIVSESDNDKNHKEHGDKYYDAEEVKKIADRLINDFNNRESIYGDLEREIGKLKKETKGLLEKLQENFEKKLNSSVQSKLGSLAEEMNTFINNLKEGKHPEAIRINMIEEVNKKIRELQDDMECVCLLKEDLENLLENFKEGEAPFKYFLSNALNCVKEEIDKYLSSKFSKTESCAEKDLKNNLSIMLSIHTMLKAKLKKARHRVDIPPKKINRSKPQDKIHIEELDVNAIELEVLKEISKEYMEKNKDLEEKNEEWKMKIREQKKESEKLAKDIEDQMERKEKIEMENTNKTKSKEEDIKALDEKHKELNEKVRTLKKEIKDMKTAYEEKEKEKKELERSCEKLEKNKTDYEKECKKLEKRIKEYKEDQERIKKSFDELLEDNVKKLEKMKESAKSSKAEDEQSNNTLREEIKKKKTDLKNLDKEYESLKAKYEDLLKSIEKLEKAIKEVKGDADRIEAKMKEKQSSLEGEIKGYKKNIKDCRDEYNDLDKKKSELIRELRKLEGSKDMLNPRVIIQYLPSEETKATNITEPAEHDPKATQSLIESIKKNIFNPSILNEVNKKMSVKYVSFANMFTDQKDFIKILEASVKTSCNDIYVENERSIMDKGIFEALEGIAKSLKTNKREVKLCINLKNESDVKKIKKEVEEFNNKQKVLKVLLLSNE